MSMWKTVAASLGLLAVMGTAQAAPITGQGTWESTLKARDINGNALALGDASTAFFYDTALNITWLADMNHAKTSGDDADGHMDWSTSVTWANTLTIGSFSGWRLPTMVDTGTEGCNDAYSGTDCGYNVQTKDGSTVYSEMAHLFHITLGNLSAYDTAGNIRGGSSGTNWGLTNTALFQNMQSGNHWSGLEFALNQNTAWYFSPFLGFQRNAFKSSEFYAVAVRPGDVLRDAGNQVPEPQGLVLALTALAGLGVALRRRRAA
jgi:hypothetical protein